MYGPNSGRVCNTHVYRNGNNIITACKTMKTCLIFFPFFFFVNVFAKCLLLQGSCCHFRMRLIILLFFFFFLDWLALEGILLVYLVGFVWVFFGELLGFICPGRFHLIQGRSSVCRYLLLLVIPGSLDNHFRKRISL